MEVGHGLGAASSKDRGVARSPVTGSISIERRCGADPEEGSQPVSIAAAQQDISPLLTGAT
jgi:hypothetical protein